LKAAEVEFCRHGFAGARMDKIAEGSNSNIKMVYRYFGSKEKLYIAVLEDIYCKYRGAEGRLDLRHMQPVEGMSRLIDFTFDNLLKTPAFVKLVMGENLLEAQYVKKSKVVPELSAPLLDAIKDLLRRGESDGVFRRAVDPLQLYVTILSMGFTHLSNRYTLSALFREDVSDPRWIEARREHVRAVILAYLCGDQT
jgi:TetR/AcrR family transcriptional regulator